MMIFLIFKMLTCTFHLPHRLFSVSEMIVVIKMEWFLILRTTNGKKKIGNKVEMG